MIKDTVQAIKNLFASRSFAYQRVFDKDNKYTQAVLMDLAKFCRAHETTYNKDERAHAAMEGRREVWLRIESHLKLTPDELYDLHKIKAIPKGE